MEIALTVGKQKEGDSELQGEIASACHRSRNVQIAPSNLQEVPPLFPSSHRAIMVLRMQFVGLRPVFAEQLEEFGKHEFQCDVWPLVLIERPKLHCTKHDGNCKAATLHHYK